MVLYQGLADVWRVHVLHTVVAYQRLKLPLRQQYTVLRLSNAGAGTGRVTAQ